ncbi:hypothetical protein F4859DRAFT_478483 [Xylaria cf. heliscus]|nr:hypothetical protein F4859DRAFT_478483 [Xylaria cf. heliscus]
MYGINSDDYGLWMSNNRGWDKGWGENLDNIFTNGGQWGILSDNSNNDSNDSKSETINSDNHTNGVIDINSSNNNENDGIADLSNSYLVYRRSKKIDDLLSGHLRTIARALNFIVRARESGVKVGDFESLAAVKPETWAALTDAPDYAAEVVVKNLLELSMGEICLLSDQATALRNEMGALGVVF